MERHTGPSLVARYPGYRSLVFSSSALCQMKDTCPLTQADTVFSSFVLWGQFPLLHLPLLSAGCRFQIQWVATCGLQRQKVLFPLPASSLLPFIPSFFLLFLGGVEDFLKFFWGRGSFLFCFNFKLVEKLQE